MNLLDTEGRHSSRHNRFDTHTHKYTHSHSHIHTHLIAQYITTDSRLLNSHIREGNVETAIHSFIQFHSVPFSSIRTKS